MAVESQPIGVVRVARQVLSSIVTDTALQIPGVIRMAQGGNQWTRLARREIPRSGVSLTIKENTISIDLYIVVSSESNIAEVGSLIQEAVAAEIEEMIGMQVHEVNVYIQDVV